MSERTILDLTREELSDFLREHGAPRFRADQIWHGIYRELASSYDAITTLPKRLRALLQVELPFTVLVPVDVQESRDGRTRKVLFRLHDGETIEAVLMHYEKRHTICVSTQVGCAVGCAFCATGKAGFVRDLTAGEIAAQVLHFARELDERGEHITNVVYMGMGEPFLNYDAVMRSILILNDPAGVGLGARRFTVSTVGIVPGIERFAAEGLQVNLAISLHAADDELRNRLVPMNRRYPIAEIMRACRTYIANTNRRVTFEIALIAGVNDAPDHAVAMAKLLTGLLCHVNLIPLNSVPGIPFRPSPRDRVEEFAEILQAAGITTTVRLGRGIEIQAGCGQLRERSLVQ